MQKVQQADGRWSSFSILTLRPSPHAGVVAGGYKPGKKHMNKFTCNGFRSVAGDISISEAAEIFASRAARREFGKTGYARTCAMGSHAQDGRLAEFSAFVGYRTGLGETTGRNINFTVFRA